jgi:hypothetical protein
LLAGCGRIAFDPVGDDGTQSGTRLKIQWNTFEDGLRLPVAIYDTVLATTCYPADVQGTTRCTPNTSVATAFSDAACTRPAIVADCSVGPYLASPAGDIHHKGDEVPATMAYQLAGTCMPFGLSGTQRLYELGARVTVDELAVLDRESIAGARLQQHVVTSIDGLRFPATDAFDMTLDTTCIPSPTSTGIECAPYPRATSSFASDAGCTQPIGVYPMTSETPEYAATPDYANCRGDNLWSRITGEIAEPASLYYDFGPPSGCQPASTTNQRFFSLGERVDVAALQTVRASRPGRFQPLFSVAEGIMIRQSRVFDSLVGDVCGNLAVSDGTRRCIQSFAGINDNVYTDAACTSPIPIAVESSSAGCAAPPTPRYAVRVVSVSCALTLELYEIAGVHAGPLYLGPPASCMPFTTTAETILRFWDVGPKVDYATLPIVDTIIE